MRKTEGISEKIKKLDIESRMRIAGINAEYEREVCELTKNHIFCEGEDDPALEDHFDFKTRKIKSGDESLKSCNDWVPKKDFAYVDIDCFDHILVSMDCGYGDCDEYAISHVIKHYRVCKRCGNMLLIETEPIIGKYGSAERSKAWCRMDSDDDIKRILREFKSKMNAKFGKRILDDNDGSIGEFYDVVIGTKIRKKPYVPKKRSQYL